jgi:hypothetical protein
VTDTQDRVMLAAASKDDACRWYRMEIPYRALKSPQLLWADEFVTSRGQVEINWSDLYALKALVIQRPVNDSVFTMVSHLFNAPKRPKIIVELDDDLWSVPSHNPAAYYFDEKRIANLTAIVKSADRVVVSTPALAARIATMTEHVSVVPNTLPANLPWAIPSGPRKHLVFSGGQTHAVDASDAFKSVRPLVKQYGATLLGHDYRSMLPGSTLAPWTADVMDHYARLRKLAGSVGLAPLEANTFNVAKSAIRLMEYAHAGILPLASPYGPYEFKPVPHLAKHQQWRRAVSGLFAMSDDQYLALLDRVQTWARGRIMDEYYETRWKEAWELD